jgi:hypothetical protein
VIVSLEETHCGEELFAREPFGKLADADASQCKESKVGSTAAAISTKSSAMRK